MIARQPLQYNEDHLRTHMTTGRKKGNSIYGAHRQDVFHNVLTRYNGISRIIGHATNIRGVSLVNYNLPNCRNHLKTIYDENIFSTGEYMRRGIDAINNVPNGNNMSGNFQSNDNDNGAPWTICCNNGNVSTLYPTI